MIPCLSTKDKAHLAYLQRLENRMDAPDAEMVRQVQAILTAVREEGDAALCRYSERFDGFAGPVRFLEPADCQAALARLAPDLRAALEKAAAHIRAFCPSNGLAFMCPGDGRPIRPPC